MFTLFTPKSANEALPEVKRMFDVIISNRNQVLMLQEELQRIVDLGSPFEKFSIKKQELNQAVTTLYKSIEDLEGKGILIKSVDEGLLDFPSLRFSEEVWLCWKAGENEIKFWHGKDEGFMGRKPLAPSGFTESEQDLEKLR